MILLKELKESDLPFLLEIRNDDSTRKNLENDTIFSLDECISWFRNTKPIWFVIYNNEQKVGYFRTSQEEVGCDIHPNYRRLGFAKSAYTKYLENKKYATLWVFEDNFAINLYKSLGFKENGEKKIIRNRKYIQMIYGKK
jgi:GNAT superfamily N-acetyltransferase